MNTLKNKLYITFYFKLIRYFRALRGVATSNFLKAIKALTRYINFQALLYFQHFYIYSFYQFIFE